MLQDKGQNAFTRVKTGRIRMMTPAFVSSRKALLLVLFLAGMAMAGSCRRRAAEVSEYRDPHPLPEEPKVVTVNTPGRYGGRFVLGQTGDPRTFNAMMANESSSGDITNLTFSSLIDMRQLHAGDRAGARQVMGSCP